LRLVGDLGFLNALEKAFPDDRLILSVEVLRKSPRHSQDRGEFGAYPRPYVRYYLMGSDGIALSLQSRS
jgi:hypothetical protein